MTRSEAGREGFKATLAQHWQGDVAAYKAWIARYGAWKSAYGVSNTWFIKFPHPGPHPAWADDQAKPCSGWCGRYGIPARDCICDWVAF